jgi:hypothetical protein
MTIDSDLNIAEIPYESGTIGFRYARVMAPDRTRWIRHGLFVEHHETAQWCPKASTLMARKTGFVETFIRTAGVRPRDAIARARRSACGGSGIQTEPKSQARISTDRQ